MKILTFTFGLLLTGSLSLFGQKPLDKPVALVKQISVHEQKKQNPIYTRSIQKLPYPIMDVERIQPRSANAASGEVIINEIKAFPNPFSTEVDVFITDGSMNRSSYKAEVVDVNGKRVHSESLFLNQTPLHLSHLSKGVYILYIEKNGKIIKQEKLVKE